MNDFSYTNIKYIYFIFVGRKLVYIGRSSKPLKRIDTHLHWLKPGPVKAVIYGPYRELLANRIEGNEIIKRKSIKHFKGTTNQKIKYDKELSIKNHRPKIIYRVGERGAKKIYVC